MFPITQEAEIWNISSLDMYLAPHKISEEPLTILFMSKKNTCFLSKDNSRGLAVTVVVGDVTAPPLDVLVTDLRPRVQRLLVLVEAELSRGVAVIRDLEW